MASPTPSGGCCWPANWDRKEAGSAPASPWPEGEASAREDNTPAVVSGDREKGELLSISSRVDEWKSSVPIPLRFSSFGEDDGFSLVCIPLEAPSEPVQPAPFFTAASSWPSRVDILNCEFEFCPTRYQLKVIDCSQGSETWSAPGLVYMYGRCLETKRRPVAPLRNPWILLYDSLKEGFPVNAAWPHPFLALEAKRQRSRSVCRQRLIMSLRTIAPGEEPPSKYTMKKITR